MFSQYVDAKAESLDICIQVGSRVTGQGRGGCPEREITNNESL